MIIYDKNGIEIIDIVVDDKSYRYKEIMNDNTLSLYFSLPDFIELPIGAYCDFKAERYFLIKPENFTQHHSKNFEYTLTLDSYQSLMKLIKFKFFTMADGVVNCPFELKFSLTVTPIQFAQLICDNMNIADGSGGWTVGACITSDPVTIDFNHDYCFDVLAKIADAFTTEWEVENKTINIGPVEKLKDSPISLQYGYNCGLIPGTSRANVTNKNVISRLFVEGSDRNIDKSTYGSATLLMPKNTTIFYKGVNYKTDATGTYIERETPTGRIVEDSLDVTKIYPKRIGTVSAVDVVNADKHLYDVYDSSIPDTLDYSQNVIDGETMTIIFQTGQLAGKEFEVAYKPAEKRFELVPLKENGENYPSGSLVPEVGDNYVVFHCSLPTEYITTAETDVLNEALEYIYENEQTKYTYTGTLDELYAKRNWLIIGGYLNYGYFVSLSDLQFLNTPVVIRITAVKEYVNKPKQPELTLSNEVSGTRLGTKLNQISTQAQATDRKDAEVLRFARRQFADVKETATLLQNSLLNFSESISPITVQTMQLVAGDESLQYRFVSSTTEPVIVNHTVSYDDVEKTLSAPAGIIQHMSLGISTMATSHAVSEYKFWNLPAYVSPVLTETSTPYYLYAKCSKTANTGIFLLSETPIALEGVEGFYHLLVGILNSEHDGDRSYANLYGYTEILPGRITTDRIVSADGNTYFDLVNNKIGGFIDFVTGLISGLIGIKNESGTVMGGLNGLADAAYRLWLGATEPTDANFSVDRNGIMRATNAIISGEFSATTGKVGGLTISDNTLSSDSMEFSESAIELLSELLNPTPVVITRVASWISSDRDVPVVCQDIVLTKVSDMRFRVSKAPYNNSTLVLVAITKNGQPYFSDNYTAQTSYQDYHIENMAAGTYVITVTDLDRGRTITLSGLPDADIIIANAYTAKTKIGNNGFFSFWNAAKYFYFSSITGLNYKGAMDMPGVLATGSVNSSGMHANKWGAKVSNSAITHTEGGVYWIPLSGMNSDNYTVQVNVGVTNCYAVVTEASKSVDSFAVVLCRISDNTAIDAAFDYVVFGDNA